MYTNPVTVKLCCIDVRAEVHPSHDKNPSGIKITKFVVVGVASNIS